MFEKVERENAAGLAKRAGAAEKRQAEERRCTVFSPENAYQLSLCRQARLLRCILRDVLKCFQG